MITVKEQKTWRGEHLGFQFKVVSWGIGDLINDGNGVWNYYVYIPELRLKEKFESLWLTPKLIQTTPESAGFVSYDYYETEVAAIDWHGGVTYYQKYGELVGHRVVEFGCDYSHLFDHERSYAYTLAEVLCDLEETIIQLNNLYPKQT